MIPAYDCNIRDYLPSESSGDVVLNGEFARWVNHIAFIREIGCNFKDFRYNEKPNNIILEECTEHVNKFRKPSSSNNVLMLIHPLSIFLHDAFYVKKFQNDVDNYVESLSKVMCQGRFDFDLVILENLHDYAAVTSLLLEDNLIDDVIFTEYMRGNLLNIEDIIPYADKEIFLGGLYYENSLSCVSERLKKKAKKVSLVSDLILRDPDKSNDTILQTRFENSENETSLTKNCIPRDLNIDEKNRKTHVKLNYDPNLKHYLPANNPDSDIVLNKTFADWTDRIMHIRRTDCCKEDPAYTLSPDKELLQECKSHIEKFRKPIDGDDVLMLVHPFYMQLHDMHHTDNYVSVVVEYLDNLLRILYHDRSEPGIVVLEALHDYASVTSLLLEHEIIDDVIITKHCNGKVVDSDELNRYVDKKKFYAGLYSDACVNLALFDMKEQSGFDNIYVVSDFTLKSPKGQWKSLIQESFGCFKQLVSLDDLEF